MAEALDELIMQGVQTALQAVVSDGGTNYWYTPDHVLRSQALRGDHFSSMPKESTVAYVITGDRKSCEDQDNCKHLSTMTFDVWGLYRLPLTPDNNEYAKSVPLVPTIQSRLARDIEAALIKNPMISQLAGKVQDGPFVDNDSRAPEDTDFEGFAVSVQGFRLTYVHSWGTP